MMVTSMVSSPLACPQPDSAGVSLQKAMNLQAAQSVLQPVDLGNAVSQANAMARDGMVAAPVSIPASASMGLGSLAAAAMMAPLPSCDDGSSHLSFSAEAKGVPSLTKGMPPVKNENEGVVVQ
jgi:hypothetical protein